MPITSGPLTSSPNANPSPGIANPLTLQAINTPNVNPANLQMNPQGVIGTLANNAPQSLSSLLLPLYSQLFSANSGALAQNYGLQASQGVAQAQSGAMQRGLTGSSIEAGGMASALAGAQQAYTQGYSSLLGNYVQSYAGAAGQDVSNQQQFYSNLAQALGQGYNSQVQQDEFSKQLQAGLQAASMNANATEMAGLYSGIGSAISGFSDIRLKKNVKKIGRKYGFNVYAYEYDREKCPELNPRMPRGRFVGFMAHHIAEKYPEAVHVIKGYMAIDYGILAARLLPQGA